MVFAGSADCPGCSFLARPGAREHTSNALEILALVLEHIGLRHVERVHNSRAGRPHGFRRGVVFYGLAWVVQQLFALSACVCLLPTYHVW